MNESLAQLHALQAAVEDRCAAECLFCGQPELASLLEVWGPREFMLETCCEGMHEAACEFLSEDPKAAGLWVGNALGLNALLRGHIGCAGGVRRVIEADGQLVLDWNLQVVPVDWRVARDFVSLHHRHCSRPSGWRFGAGLMNGADLIGVVIVGRPVARNIDQKRIVEVTRLCVREDLQAGLEWNACSQLYGWAAREAKKRGFERIITYTLASEAAGTLKAAGWERNSVTKGRRWNAPSRPREDNTPTEDKVRWVRNLVLHPASELRPSRHRLRVAGPPGALLSTTSFSTSVTVTT